MSENRGSSPKNKSKNEPQAISGKALIAIILLRAVSVLISLSVLIGVVLSTGWVVDTYYSASHQIENPVARGDDLGLGLVVVISMVIGAVISIPLFFPLNKFVFSVIKNILGEKHE